jgi:hypothetical protein
MTKFCDCGCGTPLAGMRADAVYASEACSKRARRANSPDKARTGVGSRGGNVRSKEQADYLHRQYKLQWTAKIRRHIARTLLETGRFFADDMAALEVPEEHSAIIGSQTASFAAQRFMVAIGRRKVEHKAANARKANVYEVTDKGRSELSKLVGLGASSAPDQREPGFEPPAQRPTSLSRSCPAQLAELGPSTHCPTLRPRQRRGRGHPMETFRSSRPIDSREPQGAGALHGSAASRPLGFKDPRCHGGLRPGGASDGSRPTTPTTRPEHRRDAAGSCRCLRGAVLDLSQAPLAGFRPRQASLARGRRPAIKSATSVRPVQFGEGRSLVLPEAVLMPRIRTVKPSYPKHRKVRAVSRDARLLNIHLWNLADDEGRLQELLQWIIGEVFPTDEDVTTVVLREWLEELQVAGLIVRYEVDGEDYIQCHDFLNHQVINKPRPSEIPSADAGSIHSGNSTGVVPEDSHPEVEGEKERREGKGTGKPTTGTVVGGAEEFDDWLEHYREMTGHTMMRGTKTAREAFSARRKEDFSLEELKLATVGCHSDDYNREHGHDVPDTILRVSKVTRYIKLATQKADDGDPVLAELAAEHRQRQAEEAAA